MASGDGGAAVGQPILRLGDRPLLTGDAAFVDDLELPHMLEAAFLRSPLAHARISGIDLAAAMAAPGVRVALAADDLSARPLVSPCETPNTFSPGRPLLADGVARFAGEPLAVVVAGDRYAAEDALELIDVDLDPLPVVDDVWAALADGAVPVHGPQPNNLYVESRFERGDVRGAFKRAAAVVERRIRHGRMAAVPLEPRGLVAAPAEDGLRIWASTQGPHKLRLAVAETLGLSREQIRVVCTDIGGGFGQKAHVYPEELIVALLALRLGRPVKWIEDRHENLMASSHARDQHLHVRAAADARGRLVALDVEQLVDQGAYGTYPHGVTLEALTTTAILPGPYRLPAIRVHARAIATNRCPQGAYRGVGFAVSGYVHELMMDGLADELGLDRAEIRRRNLISPDELPYTSITNQRYDSGDFPAALEKALELIGYAGFEEERRQAAEQGLLLGLGLSCYVEPTGMNSAVFHGRGMVGIEGFDSAYVLLSADGQATLWTTTPAIGQGSDTTFAQLLADLLGLAPEQVTVARSDTAVGDLEGTGTFASRSAVSGGGAVDLAGREIRDRLLYDASERLEAAIADLELVGGQVRVVGSPASAIPISLLVAEAPPDRYADSERFDPPAVAYPYATHACVVEVDGGTGGTKIRRYVVVEDCGRVINPAIVDGQVHGATAQGIATALYEGMIYDEDAQLQTSTLMDYLVPTAGELPPMLVEHLEIPSPTTVNGVKGVGEGGTVGAPAAVAGAVCHALGRQLTEVPITPQRVREAVARA